MREKVDTVMRQFLQIHVYTKTMPLDKGVEAKFHISYYFWHS